MAYVPPHKRLKDPTKPSPLPESFVTKSKTKLGFKSKSLFGNSICYSGDSVSKWFLLDSNGIKDDVPSNVTLEPVSADSIDFKKEEKPLILKNNIIQNVNVNIGESEEERSQRLLLAEKVEEDLILAYERAKTKMEEHHVLRLVCRFGRIFFYECQDGPVGKGLLKNSKKMFSTDVPTSYLEQIKSNVLPRHGFCLDKEKETYIVKVSHVTRPDETINCKCILKEDGRLSLYKAELNPLRHLVVDVSCIDKKLDMRLMLASKRKMMSLISEEELGNIRAVLASATVDPKVKGGLWWKLGEASSKDGYRAFEACNIRTTIYKSQTVRLRVKETGRFNERCGTGESKRAVSLTLKDITTKLQVYISLFSCALSSGGEAYSGCGLKEENLERGCVVEMLRDVLGTIWEFLDYDDSM